MLKHIDIEHAVLEQFFGHKGGGYYKALLEANTLVIDLSRLLKGSQIILRIPNTDKEHKDLTITCYIRGKKNGLLVGFHNKHLRKILENIVRK